MQGKLRERKKDFQQDVNGKESATKSDVPMVKPERAFRTINIRRCFFLAAIVIATCFAFKLVFGRYPLKPHYHATSFIDSLSASFGFQRQVHAVVFDAGSTGSRILVFTFHRVFADNSLKLDKELFEEVKPGLSSYADNPSKAAESLVPLLEKAKLQIPKHEWKGTPIVLKATAGLRLLPGAQAEAILTEVRKLFEMTPFLVTKDSVSIMDGTDEGLYSWFTVNFLLDTLATPKENMMASLDLGGGSTQVTLVAAKDTIQAAAPQDMRSIVVFDKAIDLYIHSYLGLGLMAARLEILKAGNRSQDSGSTNFISPCVHTNVDTKWEYGSKTYDVRGVVVPSLPSVEQAVPSIKNDVMRFEACKKITNIIINAHVYAPPELHTQRIYAMSYYYDRATESGLIDPYNGGQVTVENFFQIAKSACKHPNSEQPFSCMDLAYITSLLSQGLGLEDDKTIMLKKKIDNHEVSWALGAAFHILANDIISQ